jgi:hypothetical protein
MTVIDYKKYTVQAKVAIKGGAFFETLVSEYSIPHPIVGLKDIGIDYVCEWARTDSTTHPPVIDRRTQNTRVGVVSP